MKRLFVALVVVLAVGVGACTPRVAGLGPPVGPAQVAEDAFTTRDGLTLPLRRWGSLDAQTVVLALHGFNDYSNAFADAGPWLAAEGGVAVYAYDQRGFGAGPQPGLWAGQEALTADLADAVAALRARHPGARLVVLGESMGGAVILAALAGANPPPVDGVVLAAPAVWGHSTMPWAQRTLLRMVAAVAPGLRLSGRGLNILASDNLEMLYGLGADPLVLKRTRVDAVLGLVDLMETAYRGASAVPRDVPVLWLYGARDEVVPRRPTVEAARALAPDPAAGRRFVLYPNGWHLLLRDLGNEVVLEDIAAWLADPTAALPSGAETNPAVVDPAAPLPPRVGRGW